MESKKFQEEVIVETAQVFEEAVASYFPQLSRSQIIKKIRSGDFLVGGKSCRRQDMLAPGQKIQWAGMTKEQSLKPAPLALEVLFEDEDLMVLNKHAGVVVHPGAGTQGVTTLIEGVLYHIGVEQIDPLQGLRPFVVHRLDKDTSGVLVVAKNLATQSALAEQFAAKSNFREYIALLEGDLRGDQLTVKSYLGRDPKHRLRYMSRSLEDYEQKGRPPGYRYAESSFQRLKRFRVGGRVVNLVRVHLSTGRTHQIRVHARSIGAPVVGDDLYGFRKSLPGLRVERQMLHARILGFTHPKSGEKIAFEADIPDDFKELLLLLQGEAGDFLC